MSYQIHIKSLFKRYVPDQWALKPMDLTITQGEQVAITGASGCGKSTLLNILGLLERPSEGEYWFEEQNFRNLSYTQERIQRQKNFSFVFQQYHLLSHLTLLENVMLPCLYRGVPETQAKKMAMEQLAHLSIATKAHVYPLTLSGGQQQRLAIARAMVVAPKVLLADEPTAALDPDNADWIKKTLPQYCRLHRSTLIIVTHDRSWIPMVDREVCLQ